MEKEIVYIGHNNRIDIQLKASSAAYSLASVTNMTLTLGSTLVSGSSSASSGAITWAGLSHSTGEVRLALGGLEIEADEYMAPLVVYSPANPTGVVWGHIPLEIRANPEASS